MILVLAGSAIHKIAMVAGGMALLSGPLNNQDTWVTGKSIHAPSRAQHLYYLSNANHWHRVAQKRGGIVLDIEKWKFTPEDQQRHPLRTYRTFYQHLKSVKNKNWIIATPSFNLVKSMHPNYHGKLYSKFIQSDLAGKIASYVNVYEIQAQGAERHITAYQKLVKSIAQQVRAANPSAIVLAGLSTNPSHHNIPVKTLFQDIRHTKDMVNGYWLNVPQAGTYCPSCGSPQPQKAVKLLKAIYG